LKPNGTFAFTDFRNFGDIEQLEEDLQSFNMVKLKKDNDCSYLVRKLKRKRILLLMFYML